MVLRTLILVLSLIAIVNKPTIPELVAAKLNPPPEGWYDDVVDQNRCRYTEGQLSWMVPRKKIEEWHAQGDKDSYSFAWGTYPPLP